MLMLSSMKREIMHFHFVVRDGNEIYSVMHVQSCCFTNQRLLSRTTPLGSFFVFVFVCHLTLDIFLLFMLCVIVSEDIVSNFEAEQFGRLPFYDLGLAFSFLLGFRAIVMCACNFFFIRKPSTATRSTMCKFSFEYDFLRRNNTMICLTDHQTIAS